MSASTRVTSGELDFVHDGDATEAIRDTERHYGVDITVVGRRGWPQVVVSGPIENVRKALTEAWDSGDPHHALFVEGMMGNENAMRAWDKGEFVFSNEYNDDWTCLCGNEAAWDGYYNAAGPHDPRNVEDDDSFEWDGKSVVCDRCGRIMDATTHRVNDTGQKHAQYPDEYNWIVTVVHTPEVTPDRQGTS